MRKASIAATGAALMLALLLAGCTDSKVNSTNTPSPTNTPSVTNTPTASPGLDEIIPGIDDGEVEDGNGIIGDENHSPSPDGGILDPDNGMDGNDNNGEVSPDANTTK